MEKPLFFLIAGEASGDLLGARLMAALKKKTGGVVRFAGIGGPRMQAEGMDLLFDQAELAHFGLFELLIHIPHILKRMKETIAEIRRRRPAALITIDAPDFCFRVARKLKGEKIPLIHYVAPSVWVWRAGRARKIARFLDHLLALLPFEPPYFLKENLPTTFVGHPITEGDAGKGDAGEFRRACAVPENATLLTFLPGSRRSEIARLMPIYRETASRLKKTYPLLQIAIPTIASMKETLQQATHDWPVKTHILLGDKAKYGAFAASRAALACSGTVSIELAMAGLPSVTTYRVSTLTALLYGPFVRHTFANLVNIMHGREIVPELLQFKCTPKDLATALEQVMTEGQGRREQIEGLRTVAAWLGRGEFVPSERAAETVMIVAQQKSSEQKKG